MPERAPPTTLAHPAAEHGSRDECETAGADTYGHWHRVCLARDEVGLRSTAPMDLQLVPFRQQPWDWRHRELKRTEIWKIRQLEHLWSVLDPFARWLG